VKRTPSPTAVFLATLVVALVALFTPGPIGGVLLLVLAGALIWLLTKSWPALPLAARVVRLVVLLIIVTVALMRF
jgi:hypothetical protein